MCKYKTWFKVNINYQSLMLNYKVELSWGLQKGRSQRRRSLLTIPVICTMTGSKMKRKNKKIMKMCFQKRLRQQKLKDISQNSFIII